MDDVIIVKACEREGRGEVVASAWLPSGPSGAAWNVDVLSCVALAWGPPWLAVEARDSIYFKTSLISLDWNDFQGCRVSRWDMQEHPSVHSTA